MRDNKKGLIPVAAGVVEMTTPAKELPLCDPTANSSDRIRSNRGREVGDFRWFIHVAPGWTCWQIGSWRFIEPKMPFSWALPRDIRRWQRFTLRSEITRKDVSPVRKLRRPMGDCRREYTDH